MQSPVFANEQNRPLFCSPSSRLSSSADDSNDTTPNVSATSTIPWRQLFPILLFCTSHALTYSVIFPFIADMVSSCGAPAAKVGLYAGIAESAIMLVEVVTAPAWARVADRYGRRPALLGGFAICIFACPMLGFSTSVWEIIFWRAALGINSAGVMTNIIAAELSTSIDRSLVFSILGPAFSVGMLLGTLLGGELAHPYGRFPAILGGSSQFWLKHPFALPCILVGAIDALTILVGYLFLAETRPTSSRGQDRRDRSPYAATLKVPRFALITAVFLLYQVASFSWDGMYTVYTFTDPQKGGLGLEVSTIGIVYSVNYLISIASCPLLLPWMVKRWGSLSALEVALVMWPVLAILIPLSQWTAIHDRMAMWGVVVLQLCIRAIGAAGWPMLDMLTMGCFDEHPQLMATGSAISLMGTAGGRAFGPAISGWLFSISTLYPTGSFLRQISWIYIALVTVPALLLTRYMKRNDRLSSGIGERKALLDEDAGEPRGRSFGSGGTTAKIV